MDKSAGRRWQQPSVPVPELSHIDQVLLAPERDAAATSGHRLKRSTKETPPEDHTNAVHAGWTFKNVRAFISCWVEVVRREENPSISRGSKKQLRMGDRKIEPERKWRVEISMTLMK